MAHWLVSAYCSQDRCAIAYPHASPPAAMSSFEHMSSAETGLAVAEKLRGKRPLHILQMLQAKRAREGGTGPGKSAVYRLLAGESYPRAAPETRGRPERMPRRLLQTASRERLTLIQDAQKDPRGPHLVTWSDVHKATKKALRAKGLLVGSRMPSEDWLSRLMRDELGIRARPAKKRIVRTTVTVSCWGSPLSK